MSTFLVQSDKSNKWMKALLSQNQRLEAFCKEFLDGGHVTLYAPLKSDTFKEGRFTYQIRYNGLHQFYWCNLTTGKERQVICLPTHDGAKTGTPSCTSSAYTIPGNCGSYLVQSDEPDEWWPATIPQDEWLREFIYEQADRGASLSTTISSDLFKIGAFHYRISYKSLEEMYLVNVDTGKCRNVSILPYHDGAKVVGQ